MLGDVAQMLIGIAAIAALFIGPRMNFNSARRLAVAQNRQKWLDDVRADVAELVAIHGEVVSHRAKHKHLANKPPDPPDALRRIAELAARIRMRLNISETPHLDLNRAIGDFMTDYENANPNGVFRAMDPIAEEVWRDVKSGRL